MGWEGVRVGWALGFGDYLDAGLPVAKSAPNPYTTLLLVKVSAACCKVHWQSGQQGEAGSGRGQYTQVSRKTKMGSVYLGVKQICGI